MDRQCVHVSTQPYDLRTIAALEDTDDTCLADPLVNLQPKGSKLLCHEGCGPVLVEAQFGMCVESMPPIDHPLYHRRGAKVISHVQVPLTKSAKYAIDNSAHGHQACKGDKDIAESTTVLL